MNLPPACTRFRLFILLAFFAGGCLYGSDDTTRINNLSGKAWEQRHANLDSAILMIGESLRWLDHFSPAEAPLRHWKTRALARSYFYLGSFYNQKGVDSLALSNLSHALELSREINDLRGISIATGGLGLLYSNQGNFSKALEHYFEALAIDEKIGHREGILTRLGNIGIVYDYQQNYDKALEYYMKALEMAKALNRHNSIAIQYCNIGVVYYEKRELDKALDYFTIALKMDEDKGNKNGISRNLNNIASIYRDRKDYTKALAYFSRALKAAEEQGNMDNVASMTGDVGNMYTLLGDYPKAERYLTRAVELSRDIKSLPAVADIEAALSNLYERWGKHAQALEHYKKHVAAKDSLFNLENVEHNLRLEMNYEFGKKQAIDKAIHDKQLLLLESENKAQARYRILLFVIIGLSLVMLVIVKRAYDNKTRLARFLARESERKEVLLQEVHHRVNNNLQIISSLLTLQANSSGDPVLQEYLSQSQQRIQSLSALHELLYGQDETMEVNIAEYLEKVLSFHRDILKGKPHRVDILLNAEAVRLPAKTALPLALIVNELVTNALKHAFGPVEGGKIEIQLERSKEKMNTFVLRVKDNGKGMPTGGELNKDSLGLHLINMLAKQMKAGLSQYGPPGTTYELEFAVRHQGENGQS